MSCASPSIARSRALLVKRAERGFTVVSAIFLLVVLAGLGAAMLNISTSQHVSSQLDVQGARAYQAARAGIEWGLYEQLRLGECAAAPTPFSMPAGTTLSTFTVSVTCSHTSYGSAVETNGIQLAAGASIDVYQITATACNNPTAGNCPGAPNGPDYVERQMQVTFRQ